MCKRQIYSVTYRVKRCQFKIATYQRVFVRFCEVDARIWWVKSLISWKSIDDWCYNAVWCCLFHVEQFDTVHTTSISWKSINERLGGTFARCLFELSFQSLKNLKWSHTNSTYMSFVTGKKCCSWVKSGLTHACLSNPGWWDHPFSVWSDEKPQVCHVAQSHSYFSILRRDTAGEQDKDIN